MESNSNFKKAADIVGGLSALAASTEISPAFAWQIKEGRRACPPATAVAVERATGGQVTRKDLRPDDWQDIWPELAETLTEENPE